MDVCLCGCPKCLTCTGLSKQRFMPSKPKTLIEENYFELFSKLIPGDSPNSHLFYQEVNSFVILFQCSL